MSSATTDPLGPLRRLTPDFFADPYPVYRSLRESAPLFWSEALGRWLISRYDDVAAGLRDHERLASGEAELTAPAGAEATLAPFLRLSRQWLFFLDPPRHTAARAPL